MIGAPSVPPPPRVKARQSDPAGVHLSPPPRVKVGRGLDTPPGTDGLDFGLNEAAAATGGDVLMLDPRDPGDFGGRGAGVAVDIEKQPCRWPDEGGRNHNDGDGDGDVLDLKPDHGAVRRRVPVAPAFEKQVGWREEQAAEALEENERLQARREAWGWGETGAEAGGEGKGDSDPVERADRGRRWVCVANGADGA